MFGRFVVHGEAGLDELSPMGPTAVAELHNGAVSSTGRSGRRTSVWSAARRRNWPGESPKTMQAMILGRTRRWGPGRCSNSRRHECRGRDLRRGHLRDPRRG